MFFGIFATHLVYLGELSQIKYTAVKNKSLHYRWFIFAFQSNIWFFYKIDLSIALPVDADFLIYYLVHNASISVELMALSMYSET